MGKSWIQEVTETDRGRRLFEEERLVLEATERICGAMDEEGLSRADLAEALGTTRANVTQLLTGSRNMTLKTLAFAAFALGRRVTIRVEPLRRNDFIGLPVKLEAESRPRTLARVSTPAIAGKAGEQIIELAS